MHQTLPQTIRARRWAGRLSPARVLAIRLQALGDTILTLPYLNALRRTLPDSRLDFLTREEVAEIPQKLKLFDQVHLLGGGRSLKKQLLYALRLTSRLRTQRYDVIIDLQGNRVSRLIRILLRAPAWSEFDRLSPQLAGERTRATIEAAGLGPLDVYPDLVVAGEDRSNDKLRAAGWDGISRLVVLNPTGSFPGRSWPLEAYAAFARLWLEEESVDTQFLTLLLPGLADKSRYLKQQLGERLIDLTGQVSAWEAFLLCRRAELVLSEDSGFMHMAWVSGATTLGLFGASRGDWSRPHGNYSDCLRACQQREEVCIVNGVCHAGPPAACLQAVSAEAVLQRARLLLRNSQLQPRRIGRIA